MVEFKLKSWSNQGINNYWLSPWGFPTAGRIFSEPSVFSSRAHLTGPMSSSALSVVAVEYLEMGCGRIDRSCLQLLVGAHQLWGDLQSFLACSYIPENEILHISKTYIQLIFSNLITETICVPHFCSMILAVVSFQSSNTADIWSGISLWSITQQLQGKAVQIAKIYWDLTGKHFGCINI